MNLPKNIVPVILRVIYSYAINRHTFYYSTLPLKYITDVSVMTVTMLVEFFAISISVKLTRKVLKNEQQRYR